MQRNVEVLSCHDPQEEGEFTSAPSLITIARLFRPDTSMTLLTPSHKKNTQVKLPRCHLFYWAAFLPILHEGCWGIPARRLGSALNPSKLFIACLVSETELLSLFAIRISSQGPVAHNPSVLLAALDSIYPWPPLQHLHLPPTSFSWHFTIASSTKIQLNKNLFDDISQWVWLHRWSLFPSYYARSTDRQNFCWILQAHY